MRRPTQHGFTLLEVLVATLIMAIAVTGLLSNLSTSLRNASRLTSYDRAAMTARHKMDELLLAPRLPSQQIVEGRIPADQFGGLEAGWRARAGLFDTLPAAGPGSMVLERIELQIWWMDGEQRKTFPLEAFRRRVLTEPEPPPQMMPPL